MPDKGHEPPPSPPPGGRERPGDASQIKSDDVTQNLNYLQSMENV